MRVSRVWNFGYAARDQAGLARHLAETAARGLAVPSITPSLYGLPPDRLTTSDAITVSGDQTYAEVEYGLLHAESAGWLVVVASDHTDSLVGEANVARGKAITPDVVSSVAWRFDEVEGDFDQFVLSCEALADEPVVVQEGTVDALLSPRQLLEIAERRLGPPPPGTSASRNGRRSRAASHGLASFERSSAGKPSSRRAKR